MSKHRQAQQEGPEQPQTDDREAWAAPEFLRSRLISLAFVLAPAIVGQRRSAEIPNSPLPDNCIH